MKNYITFNLQHYNRMFKRPINVLGHLFATNGNGVGLDNKGYLQGNYRGEEAFVFGAPVALDHVYPWSTYTECQPFRKLAGCRDVGFKEAAKYFIDCIEVTPNSVDGISIWKENIEIVRSVLLDTPTIEDESPKDLSMEGSMELFLDKIKGEKTTSQHPVDGTKIEASNSVYKKWYFDVQWSDCPTYVEKEVREAWGDYELGNDRYIWRTTLDEELFADYPRVYLWLKHKGVPDGEEVIIHWWW